MEYSLVSSEPKYLAGTVIDAQVTLEDLNALLGVRSFHHEGEQSSQLTLCERYFLMSRSSVLEVELVVQDVTLKVRRVSRPVTVTSFLMFKEAPCSRLETDYLRIGGCFLGLLLSPANNAVIETKSKDKYKGSYDSPEDS